MGLTNWSASNYLSTTNMPLTAYPFIISAWVKTTDSAADKGVVVLGEDVSNGDRFGEMHVTPTGRAQAAVWDGATFLSSQTGAGIANTGSWVHLLACFNGTADRTIYANGANKVNGTSSMTGLTVNRLWVGTNNWTTPEAWNSAGVIAEVSIWDGTGWSDANRDSFAAKMYNGGASSAGANPLNVTAEASQPWTGDLRAYWINSANSITDLSGNGKNLTQTGTLNNASDHPTIESFTGGGGGPSPFHTVGYRLF